MTTHVARVSPQWVVLCFHKAQRIDQQIWGCEHRRSTVWILVLCWQCRCTLHPISIHAQKGVTCACGSNTTAEYPGQSLCPQFDVHSHLGVIGVFWHCAHVLVDLLCSFSNNNSLRNTIKRIHLGGQAQLFSQIGIHFAAVFLAAKKTQQIWWIEEKEESGAGTWNVRSPVPQTHR